jgi:NTE family protein
MTRSLEVAAVYGGGGIFGIGFGLGVAAALCDAGVPLAAAQGLGTSAGAWVAGSLACGLRYHDIVSLPIPRVPDLRPGRLLSIARDAFGNAHPGTVWGSVASLPFLRHEVLNAAKVGLAPLVAASSAVPGLFAPQRLGARFYVDGGVRSLHSAHRAPPATDLIVVVPLSGPEGRHRSAGRGVEAELARWQRRHPQSNVHVLLPSPRIAALIRQPLDLFDIERSKDAYWLGEAETRQASIESPTLLDLIRRCQHPGQSKTAA